MRHWIAGCLGAAALAAGLLAADQLGRRTLAPGSVWVVARGAPGELLARLQQGQDLRILDAWGGGRVLLLHAPSLAAAALPANAAWITLRVAPGALSLPGCS